MSKMYGSCHFSRSNPEARQAVLDRVKQRIRDKFPHGTYTRPVIRGDLSIISDPDRMLLINGSVDTTPAELHEMFSDFIFLRHVQERLSFSRRYPSDGSELTRYISE
jgi:hypothetical protein